jgi:F-type H+-transporting ATPase subunit a
MSPLLALLQAAAQHATESPAAEVAQGAAGHGSVAAAGPAEILMHHVVDQQWGNLLVGPLNLGLTKHLVFFLVTATLVLLIMRWVRASYLQGGLPTGPAALAEALIVYVRDEIAEKNIGHGEGRRFTPLLLSFFFFILVTALFGLVPIPTSSNGHWAIAGITSTANLSVTMGLAFVSFMAQQWAGIRKHGLVHHFVALVPPGLPVWLVPIMIPVELLSMFTKPFALLVRLFANMLAGHMVTTTLLMLIPLMAAVATFFGVFMIPVSLALALFIQLLEILVAFIQAYIFTLLTAIFIGSYANPAH